MNCIQRISSFAFLLVLQATFSYGLAQSMSTPYSVYGIGDVDHRVYNFNAGMGYTGLALKTSLFASGNNAASATGLEKSFFVFDASAAGRTVTYSGNSINADNSKNNDFTIKKLSFTTKLNSFWASGIGFRQYSSVNYAFQNAKQVEGSFNKYTVTYSGDGGLNDYYWNNAFALGKHLSLGVTTSFLAGPINQTESIVDNDGNTIESKRRDYYGNARFQYGLIYATDLSKTWNLSVGGQYTHQTKMNYERTLTIADNSTPLIEEEYIKYAKFSLPRAYGAGIALSSKGGGTFAADYSFEDWNVLNVRGNGWRLVNSNRISIGADFASFVRSYTRNTHKRSFQLGAFLNNSYLQVNDHQIREYGISAGITRSLKSGLMFSASLEGGVRGTTQADLIKENYAQISLTFSYRDFFNSKGTRYR